MSIELIQLTSILSLREIELRKLVGIFPHVLGYKSSPNVGEIPLIKIVTTLTFFLMFCPECIQELKEKWDSDFSTGNRRGRKKEKGSFERSHALSDVDHSSSQKKREKAGAGRGGRECALMTYPYCLWKRMMEDYIRYRSNAILMQFAAKDVQNCCKAQRYTPVPCTWSRKAGQISPDRLRPVEMAPYCCDRTAWDKIAVRETKCWSHPKRTCWIDLAVTNQEMRSSR